MDAWHLASRVWSVCMALVICGIQARVSDMGEYCLGDTFVAKCPADEIIMMKSAEYGRMRKGKCVQEDMGMNGCKENVMELLAVECSGRQECSYLVAKLESESKQPCGEMKSYLEASYECVPVLTSPRGRCDTDAPLLTHGSQGYISSFVARNTGCGGMQHPWTIEVFPGQKVNISITSFQEHAGGHVSKKRCKPLGYITEVGHRSNATICDGHGGGHGRGQGGTRGGLQHVYTSNGRHLRIHINTRANQHFILHYKLFGCADLQVTPFSWYKRDGDHAEVGCEGQDMRWELRCVGSQWEGVVGNCTPNIGASRQQAADWTIGGMDFQTMTIATIAFGFVVLVLIAMIVVVWRCKDSRPQQPATTVLVQQEPVSYRMKQPPLPPIPESQYKTLLQEQGPYPPQTQTLGPRDYPPQTQTQGHQGHLPQTHTLGPRGYPAQCPGGYPPQSQTLPRPPSTEGDDYCNDWRFGTAPWNKPNM